MDDRTPDMRPDDVSPETKQLFNAFCESIS